MTVTIRSEEQGNEAAIHDLVARAFAPMAFSDGSEADLVGRLRADGDLALSLVATDINGTIIGHVAFSPATIDHAMCGWFQMAPVSVCPAVQRQGIGLLLIRQGIDRLAGMQASGVAVVGNPDYYERFQFTQIEGLAPASQHDAPYFRALALRLPAPQGVLRYAAAFGG